MLSELYGVAMGLRAAGVSAPVLHDWVKPQERGDFVVACLGEDGRVAEIELRPSEDGGALHKIQKDNQNSFPALKLESPLWEVGASEAERGSLRRKDVSHDERAAILARLCSDGGASLSHRDARRLATRLRGFARELGPLFQRYKDEAPSVCVLLDRLLRADFDLEGFLAGVRDGVVAAVRAGRDTPRRIGETLLVGRWDGKKRKVKREKVTLVLDIDECTRWRGGFERVAHEHMTAVYHRVLLGRVDSGGRSGVCALTGAKQLIETETFPSVKFPVVQNAILLSMNRDAACNARYGLVGSSICPVGRATADEIYRAAVWITSVERDGTTWRAVPATRGDESDLMIAYVEQAADSGVSIASMICEGDAGAGGAVFEAAARSVVDALDAKGAVARDWTCRILVLRRVSKGQVQVEVDRRYGVQRIRDSLVEWRKAAADAPMVWTSLPGKERGAPPRRYIVHALFPSAVLGATKAIWIRGGTESRLAPGLELGRVFDLFLGEGRTSFEAATSLLRLMLGRCWPLLARFGASRSDMPPPSRRAAVDACAILSVCLYKLGERKELFMQEAAFLLGRFLSFVDTLHLQYCVVKRDKSRDGSGVPPQLLGNQHLAIAALNPPGALAMLCDRLRIYKAWADTDGSGEAGLAKWAVGRLGEAASALKGALPQRALNDVEKAEMLLGYLAREPRSTDGGEKGTEAAE